MNDKSPISDRGTLIQQASWVGMIGNGLLAALKIIVGFIAGSAAVIADGIDSASDILASLITFYASKVSEMPPDKAHPWGHKRAEAIAAKIISMIIFVAGLQLVISTVGMLWNGEVRQMPGKASIAVTILSILGKSVMALYKFRVAKKTNSSMMKADAINMKNDIFLSLSVLIGLGITYITNLPVIDTCVGILLGLWILRSGAMLSLETNTELMDSFENHEVYYKKLYSIANETPGVYNPHKMRIRKLNNHLDIYLDIEVDGDLSVTQGHDIAKDLETNIKNVFDEVFDVMVHVEPISNEEDEQFGISHKDIDV